MYTENDYILRLIHETVRALARLLFGTDMDAEEEFTLQDKEMENRLRHLFAMADEGRINEAENELLDELDLKNRMGMQEALYFYEYINRKPDDFLTEHNYSREEVLDGVKHVVGVYGCGSMLEAIMEDYL